MVLDKTEILYDYYPYIEQEALHLSAKKVIKKYVQSKDNYFMILPHTSYNIF
jgi:hypothetical protein